MSIHTKSLISVVLALALLCGAALADTLSFDGTVTAGDTHEVYAAIGGRVADVPVKAGDSVKAGDVIATLETTKVYASESGTITGVFGQPGDNAETVAQRYGAVLYIEGDSVFSITASTEEAYSTTSNKLVHVGENVILAAYSDSSRKGTGVVTAIEGVNYTVKVLSGSFLVGEKVTVYRGSAVSSRRIGRGTLDRTSPTGVTAQGSIVSLAVQDGDKVERGDLLFETLSGDFDGLYMSGCEILSDVDGVVSQVNAQQGGNLEKNSVVAVLYPSDALQITGQVAEEDLHSIAVGGEVSIELIWNQDDNVSYKGAITGISAIAHESNGQESAGVTYDVTVSFTPDANTRYGMSAVITTVDGGEDAEEDVDEDIPDEEVDEDA